MCSFITQHNATDVASFEGVCNWHADCRNVHQSCCPWIECSFLYYKPSLKAFQRIWQYIQLASQPQTMCNHTSPGSSIFTSKIVWDQPQLLQQSVGIIFGITKEFLHKLLETVSGKLICMLVILIGVSTWLQFIVVTDLSGQMLTFDGVWHFGEVFSSRMNPGFHCTRQMADWVYGVVWVSGLLMSTLWIEWPMVAVGLWYGQAYVMDNEHRFVAHFIDGILNAQRYSDEILRPIVVPFIHDHHLMLQHDNARPHVARICTQFLEAEIIPVLAWPAYSPDMSPIEHVWDAVDRRIWQRVPVPDNIQQLRTAIEEEWTNIPQATINNHDQLVVKWWAKANGGHTRYWLVFRSPWTPNTVKLHILECPFIVASLRHTCAIIMLSNQHLNMPHLWGRWINSAKENCSPTQM